MIFMQGDRRNADRLAGILDAYHKGSGQLVNKQKSVVFFGANSDSEMKQTVKDSLLIGSFGAEIFGLADCSGPGCGCYL
jgi:hypothetical protein